MTCPNCGKEMYNTFCMHCGYMSNGNYIKMNNGNTDADLKTVLGVDFYNIEDGKLSFTTLLFGPLYLCYRTYFWLGLVLGFLDLGSFVLIGYLKNTYLTTIDVPMLIVLIVYFLLDRAFWILISNRIYMSLLKRKIDDINRNHNFEKESYLNGVITKSKSKLFLSIIIYVFALAFLFIMFL